jgi:hypothetical protein
MMSRFLVWLSGSALVLFAANAQAATLLQENWNSGSIGANWVVSEDEPGDLELEDQGGGDFALALRGVQDPSSPSTPAWSDNIHSFSSFSRADKLQVSFLTWIKPAINSQVGIHGPFHNVGSGASYQNIEAALDYVVNDIRTSEATYDGFNGIQSGTSQPAFTTALAATNRKSNALMIRVTLDQLRGSMIEYSKNAGADPFVTIHNSLGNLTYNGQGGPKNTGSSPTVWLGFGQFAGGAGTTMIDDILLTSVPEPTAVGLAFIGFLSLLSLRRR